jgi:hypothetical protein
MALKQDDFVRAVVRLNELTRSGVIKWTRSNSPLSGPPPAGLGPLKLTSSISYRAVHEGRVLRITQYLFESSALGAGAYKYVLEVANEKGNAVFEFPEVQGISDLFNSIQTQELDIESFIKTLASA